MDPILVDPWGSESDLSLANLFFCPGNYLLFLLLQEEVSNMPEYTGNSNYSTFGPYLLVFLGPSTTIWQRMALGLHHPRLGKLALSHPKGGEIRVGEIRKSRTVNLSFRCLDKPSVNQMG